MILVDSSVWIEYYRAKGDARYKRWVTDAIRRDQVAVNAIVAAEILTFTRDRGQYETVAADFQGFPDAENRTGWRAAGTRIPAPAQRRSRTGKPICSSMRAALSPGRNSCP